MFHASSSGGEIQNLPTFKSPILTPLQRIEIYYTAAELRHDLQRWASLVGELWPDTI